jgi:hypothetical protein
MDQKNRLLREAWQMMVMLADGSMRPLGSLQDMKEVTKLRDRIAKNLKIDYSNVK